MIDLHTHALPFMDDGAKDEQTSLAMMQAELAQGVTEVVFTPHYYGKKHSPEKFLSRRENAFSAVQAQIPQGLKTRLGAEVHFTGVNVPDYDQLIKLAIQDTQYILIEFPFTAKWTGLLMDKLSDFVYETGYTPIIAHIERYIEVQKRPAYVQELLDMGCLLQVNARAFSTRGEKQLAYALLKRGWVHCIASDAHDTEGRSPSSYVQAKACLQTKFSAEWEQIQTNMQKILANDKVLTPDAKPLKKIFGRII